MKKLFILISFFYLSIGAFADDNGVCGDGVTYSYESSTKTLTINKTGEGTGEMTDYDFVTYHQGKSRAPWFNSTIQKVIVGDGVTRIGDYAFYFCKATSITLPSSLVSIGYGAFDSCKKLATLNIPQGVQRIEGFAFSGCEIIESIEIPESVTSLGQGALSGCSKLQSAILPQEIESIESNLCFGCSSLKSIVIPKKVKEIKSNAFESCDGLVSVTIPSNVSTIGDKAFYKCTGLKEVIISDIRSWCDIDFADYGNPLYYAHHLFVGNVEIHDLVIPDGVVAIKTRAFIGFSELKTITISSSVKTIDVAAFYECTSLRDVNIPQNVSSIEKQAFYGCSSLTNINLPTSLSTISMNSFKNCSKLESISIPEGVQLIDSEAFGNCESLSTIYISSTVKTIKAYAFKYCTNIRDVFCYRITPPTHDGYYVRDVAHMFVNSSFKTATLHVPESAIEAYEDKEKAYPWSDFGNIVALTEEDETGISANTEELAENKQFFTLDGKRINNPQKGVNIVRMPNGRTKKMINK